MKVSRRKLLMATGTGALAGVAASGASAAMTSSVAPHTAPSEPSPARGAAGTFRPVRTLNGWTLPHRMRDGVKEFHLVAEEFEHEFAPGCKAKVWGYNGSTPGPTIEVMEGDRVRLLVTNRLGEPTTMHWHGIILPSGMDGIAGLTQPPIMPGETYAYEFTLRQHGTHMYHPHADELTQMAMGMMGMFIIHPREGEQVAVDRDYCFMLHNWALHPGTYRPDPAIMLDFDLWTFNSKVFPAIDSIVARTGERVRIRMGNLSMWNHPIHLHGVEYFVTGSDGGRWPRAQWRRETTEIVAVGQTRDIEFIAAPGDWAFHCHMAHHVMNAMGHSVPNLVAVDQSELNAKIAALLPGYMSMGENGMWEHSEHSAMGHLKGPQNTLPMMGGAGPFGTMDMGGMFTVVKVRDGLAPNDYSDPGWYKHPRGTVAQRISSDADFGEPIRRPGVVGSRPAPAAAPATEAAPADAMPMDHSKMDSSR